jgi:hypothetical protein
VSAEGAWTDAVPAFAGIALPEAMMAGISAVPPPAVAPGLALGLGLALVWLLATVLVWLLGLAGLLALLWPERARPETDIPVDCAVPAPVT